MFNNFINRHDLVRLIWGLKHGYLSTILSRLTKNKVGRVKDAWKKTSRKPSSWWIIPEVSQRMNLLMTGDEKSDYYNYIAKKYFADKKNLLGMSLGCGNGHRERRWASLCNFKKIYGYDISGSLIQEAKKQAHEKQLDQIIEYFTADIHETGLPENQYDAVFVEQSLHHFSPLKELLIKINNSLKPDGLFIVNEYVGPSRFQRTKRQLEVINAVRSILPEKLKSHIVDGSVKKVICPSRMSMIFKDPSEAVESAMIVPLLYEIFDVVEMKPYEVITHILFDGIAHNFLSDDVEVKRYLRMCFDIEDVLMQTKELPENFVLMVCKKKQ